MKKRHWKLTLVELLLPLVFCLSFLATVGAFTEKDSHLDSYFNHEFYTFVQYLGVFPLLFVSFAIFINFQIPREREINVSSTLTIMNVSPIASEVSLMILQQVSAFIVMTATAAVQVIYIVIQSFTGEDPNNIARNKFVVLLTMLNIENMIVIGIIISRLSSKSLLISTQIGQLI